MNLKLPLPDWASNYSYVHYKIVIEITQNCDTDKSVDLDLLTIVLMKNEVDSDWIPEKTDSNILCWGELTPLKRLSYYPNKDIFKVTFDFINKVTIFDQENYFIYSKYEGDPVYTGTSNSSIYAGYNVLESYITVEPSYALS